MAAPVVSSGDASSADKKQGGFVTDLSADDSDNGVIEIESLCFACHKNGMTRLLLTRIPFFREVVISSFQCDHCSYRNNSIQSAGEIQEKGVKISLTVTTKEDLDRQVVKSNSASLSIPVLELEQDCIDKGEITTVEGLLAAIADGLGMLQIERRQQDPEIAGKIDAFISKVEALKEFQTPFELIIEDPSGNSFIENPFAPNKDQHLKVTHFTRTKEQDRKLGLVADEDAGLEEEEEEAETQEEFNPEQEVMSFDTICPHCKMSCKTNMKMVDIPFFKKVVIMATNCDACGVRDNEVKGGAGIEPKGRRLELNITCKDDYNRDVLKSETCSVVIPALELELEHGTLGGKFTTIEGLLVSIHEQLGDKNSPGAIGLVGDSSTEERRAKYGDFLEKLAKMKDGEMLNIQFILDDPAGNSFIQNVYAPDPDPELKVTEYERNWEQNEILGLNDMCTENYENRDGN